MSRALSPTAWLWWLMPAALAFYIPASALAPGERQPQAPGAVNAASDPVADLQRKIDRGQEKLDFDAEHGYLRSLLDKFGIPVSSQVLVFSRSNFQLNLVSPERPRALYFRDDVYVGWVRGGSDLEIASLDPKAGPVFYTLAQENGGRPKFERQTSNCLVCHDSSQTADPIPRLLMLSVLPDPNGSALNAAALVTNDRSPFVERWGGWYVTGTHGKQRHLGNTIVRAPATAIDTIKNYAARMNLESGANVTDLTGRLDSTPYLSPHSDIVALMILGHQTHVHNLMTLATYEMEAALLKKLPVENLVTEGGEKIVRAMLFADAAPLTDPVRGTSNFAAEFTRQGPRDSRGRSLRDLDLDRRLLRYPLSYTVYSPAFGQMPDPLRTYVGGRLRAVLSGEDRNPEFAHLSEADRVAILEILRETKTGFASVLHRENKGRGRQARTSWPVACGL